jgi:hypothetical protein
MDGNNSAKRLDGSGHTDPRVFTSNLYVSPSVVEKFRDEVKSRSNKKDPECSSEMKVSKTVDNPASLRVFDQTGIFILTCRHQVVEKILEMKKSGEL